MGGLTYGGGGVKRSLMKLQCELIDLCRAGERPGNRLNWWMEICVRGQCGDCQETWPSQAFQNPCMGPDPRRPTKTRPSFPGWNLSWLGKLGEEGDSLRWICVHWHNRNDLQRRWGVDVRSFPANPERNDSTSNINERLSQRSELLNVVELLVVMTISNQHWNIVTGKEEKSPIDFISSIQITYTLDHLSVGYIDAIFCQQSETAFFFKKQMKASIECTCLWKCLPCSY